ncbi:MAG: DUF6809 family protein [Sporolactobacillus sp.]
MDDLLEKLYRHFYTQPAYPEWTQKIEGMYHALSDHLTKEDQQSVLRLLDAKDVVISEISMDSFIRGVQLGYVFAQKMKDYTDSSDQ